MQDPLQTAPEPRQCPPSSTGNTPPVGKFVRGVCPSCGGSQIEELCHSFPDAFYLCVGCGKEFGHGVLQCYRCSTGNTSTLVEVSRVVDGRFYEIREVPGRYLVKFFDHGEEAGGGSFPIESVPGDEVQDGLNAYCQAVDRGEDWLS